MTSDPDPDALLAFWFDETPAERRFVRDPVLDATIARRFGALHAAAMVAGPPADWLTSPRGRLAAIILLDQFSRNLHRDTAAAFAADSAALSLAEAAIAAGDPERLTAEALQFLYMPFMHSEDAGHQARAVALFASIGNDLALDYARQHQAIIDRFGRFPHRNAALGRVSTAEELAFLAQPGSSF